MVAWGKLGWAAGLLFVACGGSEFESGGSGGGAGTAGSGAGGVGASGGGTTGGAGGGAGSGGDTGGAPSGGGTAGSDSGVGGAGGDASVDSGPGPIVIVQASETELSLPPEGVSSLSLPAKPSPGNSIIAGITCISEWGYDADAGVSGDCILSNGTVTDNAGNTYTRVVQGEPIKSSHQSARSYVFIAQNISVPSGSFVISVDPEGPPMAQAIAWGTIEVSGLHAPPSLDAWGVSQVGGTNATSTTATTDLPTTQANELAVGVLSMRSNDTNMLIAPEATWVSHHLHQNSTDANMNPPGHSMISKILTTTGVVSHTWTHDTPTRGVAAVVVTFKGASPN